MEEIGKMGNVNIFKRSTAILIFLTLAMAQNILLSCSSQFSHQMAAGKLPTSSTSAFKNLSYATDGIISTSNYANSGTATGLQWVQLDLGASYNINDIKLWHYFGDSRTYHDVIVMVSNSPSFAAGNYQIVFKNHTNNSAGFGTGTNSEYAETSAKRTYPSHQSTQGMSGFIPTGALPTTTTIMARSRFSRSRSGYRKPGSKHSSNNIFKRMENLAMTTDGIKSTSNYANSNTATGLQWVQLNLGAAYNLNDIKVWHYFGDARKYHDVIVMVSNDPNFGSGNYTIVYNNDTNNSAGFGTGTNSEYAESSTGLDIPFTAVNAQYVRLYSNGSTVNSYNHYGEVEVYAGTGISCPYRHYTGQDYRQHKRRFNRHYYTDSGSFQHQNKSVIWASSNTAIAT